MNTIRSIRQSLFALLLLAIAMPVIAKDSASGINTICSLERTSNNEVAISYVMTIGRNSVSSCRTVYITPCLKGEGKEHSFSPVVVKGKSRNQAYERWVTLNGEAGISIPAHAIVTVDNHLDQEVNFSLLIPYEEWMDGAELNFEERIFYCGREEEVSNQSLAYLVESFIDEPEPEIIEEPIVEIASPVKGYKVKEGVAYISFEQGKSKIHPLYANNREEFGKIAEVIQEIEDNESAKIVGVELIGYASPEGSYEFNNALSQKRTEAMMDYIIDEFDLHLSRRQKTISAKGEDWDGLCDLLDENHIPFRNQVLKIVNGYGDPDEKEQRLKAIAGGEVYRVLLNDFYPQLRRTEYRIQYKVIE